MQTMPSSAESNEISPQSMGASRAFFLTMPCLSKMSRQAASASAPSKASTMLPFNEGTMTGGDVGDLASPAQRALYCTRREKYDGAVVSDGEML